MDPVTTAILSAVAAGAAVGTTDTVKQAIGDAYAGLKDLLKRKFGAGSDVVDAVAKLEGKPDSAGRKETLAEEITSSGADKDAEIVAAAERVLAKLQELPAGERQHIQQAIGSYIAQADRGSTAKVNVNRKD